MAQDFESWKIKLVSPEFVQGAESKWAALSAEFLSLMFYLEN